MVRMRLEPNDDYLHPVEEASNYNESRYYNFFSNASGLGGWVRMGNRPNEGYAEMTVCVYLPDGRVAFMYKRPEITNNDAHDAAGLRFEVVAPYEQHRVTYDGKLCVLERPRDMADPKAAFTSNPFAPAVIDLDMHNVGRAWGGEPEWDDDDDRGKIDPEKMFARGHTEQHMAITGTVKVGDESFDLGGGLGMRDHSWGPRFWQNVWWYRWLTLNLGPNLGGAVTIAGTEDDDALHSHGFIYDVDRYGDDRLITVRNATLKTDYDDDFYPLSNHLVLTTDDHVYEVEGDIWSSIPLRNRREGLVTRITEGMTRWSCEGHEGSGLTEHLDQIVNDRPVGTLVGS